MTPFLLLWLWIAFMTDTPARHFDFQMLITHACILATAGGSLLTGIAAWRNASSGRKTSERNEAAILVIHGLVNGRVAAIEAELVQANSELSAIRGRNPT